MSYYEDWLASQGGGLPSTGMPRFSGSYVGTRTKPTSQKKKQGRGGSATSFISEGGALAGGAAGATVGSVVPVVGTAIGGLLGAGIGAFAGRLAENRVRDDRVGLGDAAKEATLTAALGAPGRAIKYGAKTVSAAKGGDKLTDALKAGAGAADAPTGGIRAKLGEQINRKSNDLLVKEFGLTPTQLTNFKKKYGEDVTTTVRRHNLTGKNSDDIQDSVLRPLQDEFDNISKAIPGVSRKTVESAFKSKYAPLLNSAVQDNKSIGKQLKAQSDSILKKYGDTVDANELNTIRKEFDSLVSYADKQANPARYGVNKRAADALRTALQKEADRAGVKSSTGQSFKEVGQELSKLRQLSDNIARQENNGRGSRPAGLLNMAGGILGGATGDPLSALGGIVATQAINSPSGRRTIAKGAEKLGQRVSSPGNISKPSGFRIGATGALGAGAAGIFAGQSLSNSNDNITAADASNPPMKNANIPQQYSNSTDLSSGLSTAHQPSRYPIENAMADIQRDPDNADYYMKLYEFTNPQQKEDGNGLDSTTANMVASSANATNTLNQLEGLFGTAGGGSGKIGGGIKNALAGAGLEGNTQTYNDLSASSVSQLARALNGGGQVSDADAAVVVQALPKITDRPEVARAKFAALRARLAAARQNTLMYNSGATPTNSGLGSALTM